MRRLYVLGTGHAMVTRLYNSSFALEEGGRFFLLDAGGGNGVLQAMEAMGIPACALDHMFLSHTHTDHILGGIWVVRAVGHAIAEGTYQGVFTIWGHRELIAAFEQICRLVLAPGMAAQLGKRILLRAVEHGARYGSEFGQLEFFDTGCVQVRQFGCSIHFHDGRHLAYLGDDPIRPCAAPWIQGCDSLIAEALCLESERELHHPEKSFHSSVAETCRNAQALGIKTLILCHTEDTHGTARKRLYTGEGARYFHGTLLVPDDREILMLG